MNTPPGDVTVSTADTPAVAPAILSATRPLYWSVRRELWENRSITVAPLVAAALVLFGFTIRTLTLPGRLRALPALDSARLDVMILTPFTVAASVIIVASYIVGVFYSVDALHGERRDRSILFWKSLPVSDRTTVLAKAGIPLVVLPLIAFAASLVILMAMLLLNTVVLLGGFAVGTLWTYLFQMAPVLVYGLVVHALWHAPLWAWLLLVSSWARRTPLLWALLPPLALGVVEKIAFQTSYVGLFMKYRVMGAMAEAFVLEPGSKGHVIRVAQVTPLRFLGSPGLWIGLAFAALFLAMAVRLRRHGEPL